MATVIRDITVTIDGISRKMFKCCIGETDYYVSDIQLSQKQAEPNELTFDLSLSNILETVSDAEFASCATAIGRPISLEFSSETSGLMSLFQSNNQNLDGTLKFKGVITNMQADKSARSYIIKVTAKSFDFLLTIGKSYRSFIDHTLKEIVEEIIDNYQGDVEAVINPATQDIIPYTVQYQESDYDFLKRLASTYGEWLYSDGEKLIFGQLETKDGVSLSYMRGEMANYKVETKPANVSQSFIAKNYRTGSYSVQETEDSVDETVESSAHPLLSKIKDNSLDMLHKLRNNIIRTQTGGNSDSEFDDLRTNLAGTIEAGRKLSEALKYSGTTFCTKLGIGRLLSIENSMFSNLMQGKLTSVTQEDLFITEITHYVNIDGGYANEFIGKPLISQKAPGYKFQSTPKALSCTAKVVDNEDPENLGRVRVQFDWQQDYGEDMVTPWLRLIHPYGGKHKGFSFIPEVGEEVLVDFVGGNPEKPFVVGSIFNGIEITDPAWLPGNNQVKAIRTRNGHTVEIWDAGEGGYIRIYDKDKENYILTFSTDEKLIKLESTGNIELYAQNDIIMHAGHDINASADNDVFIAAGHDMQRTADNDIREHAGNDRSTSIDRNDSLNVSQNQFVQIDENKDENITHKLQLTAENIRTEAKDKLLEYSTTHHMKSSDTLAVNAANRIDIKAAQVKTN